MLKDPLTRWQGPFPYDLLAPVGITPQSSLKEVMDASYDLMAQGLMTPDVRAAWDKLRHTSERLVVDFFLYDIDLAVEARRHRAALDEHLRQLAPTPDLSHRLQTGLGDLRGIEQDCKEIPLLNAEVGLLPEFEGDVSLPKADLVRFDR